MLKNPIPPTMTNLPLIEEMFIHYNDALTNGKFKDESHLELIRKGEAYYRELWLSLTDRETTLRKAGILGDNFFSPDFSRN